MGMSSVEIICSACGRESLLKREPVYDGFRKAGERLACAACGYEYAAGSEIPFKPKPQVKLFDESDAPRTVRVFREHEADRLCRHCRHFVVNPFLQRCGKHGRQVEATDSCRDFEKRILPKK